jgi:hypothetical protein
MVWVAGGLNVFHTAADKFFEPSTSSSLGSKPDVVLVSLEPQMGVSLERYLARRPSIAKLAEAGTRVLLVRESRDVNLAHWGPTALPSTIRWIHEALPAPTPQPAPREDAHSQAQRPAPKRRPAGASEDPAA